MTHTKLFNKKIRPSTVKILADTQISRRQFLEASFVYTDTSSVRTEESSVCTEDPSVRTKDSSVRSEESPVRTEESSVRTEESSVRMEECSVRTEESSARKTPRKTLPPNRLFRTEKSTLPHRSVKTHPRTTRNLDPDLWSVARNPASQQNLDFLNRYQTCIR